MAILPLYALTVLIWGSTWLIIKFQLGLVPVEVSVFYRFFSAALILLLLCLAFRRRLHFPVREHGTLLLQGFTLFCLNYVLVYRSEEHLPSGVVAVIFSLSILFNMVGMNLFFQKAFSTKRVGGALLGIGGVILLFFQELQSASSTSALVGIWYGLGATLSASGGNLLAYKNHTKGVPVLESTALSMTYGSLLLGLYICFSGIPFDFEVTFAYTASLIYLSLFGSVCAFLCYLTLISRMGADRASYTSVMIPGVAMIFSTLFEGYWWSATSIVGLLLALLGNTIVVLSKESVA